MTGTATTQMALLNAFPPEGKVTLDELTKASSIERRFVINGIGRLIVRGYVARKERGEYTLTKDGQNWQATGEELKSGKAGKRNGVKRCNSGSLRQRLWNAMRQKGDGGFSLPDLLMVALHPHEDVKLSGNNAEKYLRRLKKTGYLLTINRRQPGTKPGSNGFQIYKIDRDLGDKAPVVRERSGHVYDPKSLTQKLFKHNNIFPVCV